jgi:hypothetical protein
MMDCRLLLFVGVNEENKCDAVFFELQLAIIRLTRLDDGLKTTKSSVALLFGVRFALSST